MTIESMTGTNQKRTSPGPIAYQLTFAGLIGATHHASNKGLLLPVYLDRPLTSQYPPHTWFLERTRTTGLTAQNTYIRNLA